MEGKCIDIMHPGWIGKLIKEEVVFGREFYLSTPTYKVKCFCCSAVIPVDDISNLPTYCPYCQKVG